jgi:predicted amidohydrolase YtcJ
MVSLKMLKTLFNFLGIALLLASCSKEKEAVDLVVHHARIYSVDSAFTVYEALCVKDGKIVKLGTNKEIQKHYEGKENMDANGKTIFPGFIDAHCHFLGYGLGLQQLDLTGTKSFEEVMQKVIEFSKKDAIAPEKTSTTELRKDGPAKWIIGRGWDQNNWLDKHFPMRFSLLDSLFPNTPVLLTRIDGHAALANGKALELAGITGAEKIKGGEVVCLNLSVNIGYKMLHSNLPTGMLIDNAVDLVKKAIPKTSREDIYTALLNAQNNCFAVGLTTVDDAGVMKSDIDPIDELQKAGKLKMRIYAMISDSAPNYAYYLEKGPYKTARLNVRSFKFYADGALGSRGACLFKDYSDKPNWKGFLLSSMEHFETYAEVMDKKGFQMNTHCIGDSALNMVMDIYIRYCNEKKDHRWRIEHAQVVTPDDFKNFSEDIIPSVQPTHATSDMYWVKERLGEARVKYAYAYKDLLDAASKIALGTDFPVEDISPIKTFYAAVVRKDAKGYPEHGFQPENALTREQALRGMTIWAAYSNFEEQEKGSLEAGKYADFVMLDTDLMTCKENAILKTKVLATFINGEKVFSIN